MSKAGSKLYGVIIYTFYKEKLYIILETKGGEYTDCVPFLMGKCSDKTICETLQDKFYNLSGIVPEIDFPINFDCCYRADGINYSIGLTFIPDILESGSRNKILHNKSIKVIELDSVFSNSMNSFTLTFLVHFWNRLHNVKNRTIKKKDNIHKNSLDEQ